MYAKTNQRSQLARDTAMCRKPPPPPGPHSSKIQKLDYDMEEALKASRELAKAEALKRKATEDEEFQRALVDSVRTAERKATEDEDFQRALAESAHMADFQRALAESARMAERKATEDEEFQRALTESKVPESKHDSWDAYLLSNEFRSLESNAKSAQAELELRRTTYYTINQDFHQTKNAKDVKEMKLLEGFLCYADEKFKQATEAADIAHDRWHDSKKEAYERCFR